MEIKFDYKIGDKVFIARELDRLELEAELPKFTLLTRKEKNHLPTPLPIVERLAQECHGGMQTFYCLRIGEPLSKFTALELVPEAVGRERLKTIFDDRLKTHIDFLKSGDMCELGRVEAKMRADTTPDK